MEEYSLTKEEAQLRENCSLKQRRGQTDQDQQRRNSRFGREVERSPKRWIGSVSDSTGSHLVRVCGIEIELGKVRIVLRWKLVEYETVRPRQQVNRSR